ncbi:hypothetical protein GCM10027168_09630 [Streptomyces capparidis]
MHDVEWPAEFETIVRAHLPHLSGGEPLLPDASLVDLGLDSLATVTLIGRLEAGFEVTIPIEDLVAESFARPGTLWSAVRRAREAAAGGAG